ncbi:hypothetical protein N7494_010030 [Penicillium frequentans]|uniref:RBR-type E3 ubiquitin transferase n=1 Tax=Penicillium frequentans TaxID=3151616 RepID=A0AAD6GDZ8_9EURO|nr:hypothetical protein N7494_010030 [Penicillium glabrum]
MTEAEDPAEDDRSVELSSIVAIFPETKIDPDFPFKAVLDLPVTLPSPTRVSFQQPLDGGLPAALTPPTSVDVSKADLEQAAVRDVHILSHLPPLNLEIELPDGYPSEKPPRVKLTTHPRWLSPSTLTKLVEDCERLWNECGQDMVVYTYIDHLHQLAETAFGIQDASDGELSLSRDLKVALLDFNNKAEREHFEQQTFECGVCLEPKKGVNCHRLLRCSHVFCVPCLQDFYNTSITEGDVDNVKCMAPDCDKNMTPIPAPGSQGQIPRRKKHDTTLGPNELLQIPLAPETVQRYVLLKRKKKIEADKTTIYCPRQWCQGAARSKRHPKPLDPMADDLESSDEEEDLTFDPTGDEAQLPPPADRVAICEDCNYAFCSVCRGNWHGVLVRCYPRRVAERTEEEKATDEYLRLYTSPCPTCNVPCQKLMGCNHMRCRQCDTHFCYLCSSWLPVDNPYKHFNNGNNGCFNRLWDLEGGDGLNPVGAEALHRIPEHLLHFDDEDDDNNSLHDDDNDDDDDDDENELPVWDFDFSDDEADLRRRPPPPAPVPPRPPHAAARGPGDDQGRAARAAALERQAQARAIAEVRIRQAGERPRRRVRPLLAGRHPFPGRPGPLPGRPVRLAPGARPDLEWQAGLQHFLALVQDDREDEWDSDELDEADL